MRDGSIGARVNRALGQLLLLSETKAVDTTRDQVSQGKGGHGSHAAQPVPSFGAEVPLVIRWVERLERVVLAMERDLEQARTGATPLAHEQDKQSPRKRAEDRDLLAEVGRDPTWVAFLFGRTTDGVRRLRLRHGLDPDTGERIPRVDLHPADRDTLERLEETP